MIETAYVTISASGGAQGTVVVQYFEDDELREGPATFPARYASFAGIIAYCEAQFTTHHLSVEQRAQIQGLLGSPWPARKLTFKWADSPVRPVVEAQS